MNFDSRGTVAIIGQGYVGLPLAIGASNAGWNVVGIDISKDRVDNLNLGLSNVVTVKNNDLIKAIKSGRYKASSNFANIIKSDVIVICLPTPLNDEGQPDLSILLEGVSSISSYIKDEVTIISESTSYPGTLRNEIISRINSNPLSRGKNVYFAVAPERVNPGDKDWNLRNTPRIVAGIDPISHKFAVEFYKSFCDIIIEAGSPEEAEAAKILENSFRLINISFINEFSRVCNVANLDSNRIIDLASTKPYGFMPFRPGIGAGGHCIPIDPIYYSFWAQKMGERAEMVETAAKINSELPKQIAEKAIRLLDPTIAHPKIMIIGLAYKSGTSDFRESPSIHIAEEITNRGIEIIWHDPFVAQWGDSKSSKISTECDIIIFAVDQPGIDKNEIISKGKPILNCTQVKFDTPLVKSI